jgi:hypothetical protein
MRQELLSGNVQGELWDEGIWDELLTYIEAEDVIPIIGPDLLQVDIDGHTTLLDRYLAERLAAKLNLPISSSADDLTLNNVVSQLLRCERRERIYSAVSILMNEASLSPPEPLNQLAKIRHFNLFVTTTFDRLLERALSAERFGNKHQAEVVDFWPNKEARAKDLKSDKSELPATVFYLMGRISTKPYYVLTEEDLLEFVCAIQSKNRRPVRLFDELEKNHLLILGANFSDWLTRIFLRTAKQHRLSGDREVLEILADSRTYRDPSLVFFLKHFSGQHTKVFPCGGAVEFVAELWERWRARNSTAVFNPLEPEIPPSIEMPPDAIFISYAREDAAAVKRLKAGIDAAGLGVTVWYDKEQLKGGQSFESEIKQHIANKCSCFVPILSRNTEHRDEGFFRKEWNWAVDREQGIDRGKAFIVPVIVDDTDAKSLKHQDKLRRFSELHILHLEGGQVTPEFVQRMKLIVAGC